MRQASAMKPFGQRLPPDSKTGLPNKLQSCGDCVQHVEHNHKDNANATRAHNKRNALGHRGNA